MKKTFLLILGFLLLQACTTSKNFTAYWNSHQASNDFSGTEAIAYQQNDQISIKVFNDQSNVDVILETNSVKTLQKIYNLGLSVWIDPDGKSRNVYAINFPLPTQFPFSSGKFRQYVQGFSTTEFQEELGDRFQKFEIIDTRIGESLQSNILNDDESIHLKLSTNSQILFSYHLQLPLKLLFPAEIPDNPTISIGIANINEANQKYYSAMSSKEVIKKNLEELKVGAYQNRMELEEWWLNFKLASESLKF